MRAVPLSAVLLLAAVAVAGPAPTWPEALPSLRLSDPLGRQFTGAELTEHGAVVIVTAPTQAQGGAQQAWSDAFQAAKRDSNSPPLVLLEDMAQSWFRPIVLSRMKASYRPGGATVLLLDEGGAMRKALGVAKNATVAFAFAPRGRLVAVETEQATVALAEKLLRAATGEAPALPPSSGSGAGKAAAAVAERRTPRRWRRRRPALLRRCRG